MSHKIECGFCHKQQGTFPPGEMIVESSDRKSYICSLCIALCQSLLASNWKAKGGKLKLVKDPL